MTRHQRISLHANTSDHAKWPPSAAGGREGADGSPSATGDDAPISLLSVDNDRLITRPRMVPDIPHHVSDGHPAELVRGEDAVPPSYFQGLMTPQNFENGE